MGTALRKKDEIEMSLLKQFGLRISILAAWEESLRSKGIAFSPTVDTTLARARVKISSGCFTACDVGCDLGRIEGALTSAAGSGEEGADQWLELLADSMSENAPVDEIVKKIEFPAVKMHYNRFNFDCVCGTCDAD